NWELRKPTEVIIDPGTGHLKITSVTAYEKSTGLPIESRQPKEQTGEGKSGLGAGTTKTLYYGPGSPAPCTSSAYAGLPCETFPAAQASSGSERPELLVRRIASYNA